MHKGKDSKKDKQNQTLIWMIVNTIINFIRLIVDILRNKH